MKKNNRIIDPEECGGPIEVILGSDVGSRPQLKGGIVLKEGEYIMRFIRKLYNKYFKSNKPIEQSQEQKVEEKIEESKLTDFQQSILDKCCKIFKVNEEYIHRKLGDCINSYYIYNNKINFVHGKFKFSMYQAIEIGIYDATEPELYERILSIYSINNEIKVNYKSGVWDNKFLKTLDNYIKFQNQEAQKKIDEQIEKERIKQERIQKMFAEPLDKTE